MNKRKFDILILIFGTIFFLIFSSGNTFAQDLTIEEARKHLKESPDYIKMEANYEKSKISYNESYYDYVNSISDLNYANANATSDSDAPYKAYLQFKSALEKKDSAQDTVDDNERNLNDFEYKLDYLLEKEYTSLLQLEGNYDSSSIKLELKKVEEQLAGLKYSHGIINKDTYNGIKKELLSAEQTFLDAKEKLIQGKKDFCYFLGIDYDEDLNLSVFEPEEFLIPDKDTLLSRANSSYYTFTVEREELEDLRDQYDDEYDYYTRENLRWNIIVKELDYKKTKLDFENSISTLFKDYEKELLAWQIAEANYESQIKDFKIAELKYKKGLISENAFKLAEETYKEKENEWLQNKYNKYFLEYKIKLAEKGILV